MAGILAIPQRKDAILHYVMNETPRDILTDVLSRKLGGVKLEVTAWTVHPIGYPGVSEIPAGGFV